MRKHMLGLLACCVVFLAAGVPGAAAVSGAGGAAGWSVIRTTHPASRTGGLFGESCPTKGVCVAVGWYAPRSGGAVHVMAEQSSNGTWRAEQIPGPAGQPLSQLFAVSCPSVSFCAAAGLSANAAGNWRPLIEERTAGRWHVESVPSPNPGGPFAGLAGISCSGPASCLAVGGFSDPQGNFSAYSERWDGHGWTVASIPVPSGTQFSSLNAVSCASERFCVAAGAGGSFVEQWDGAHWHVVQAPVPSGAQFANLFGVSCPTTSACEAVGNWDSGSLAERWNGHSWQVESPPLPAGANGGGLFSVSCPGSNLRCMAVGNFGPAIGAPRTYGARRTASGWTLDQPLNPPGASQNALWAVACRSASLCSAVGQANTNGTPIAIAQRWNSTGWVDSHAANPVGAANAVLNHVTCLSPSDCLAVGTIGPNAGQTSGFLTRWTGKSWQPAPIPSPSGAALNYITCVSRTECMTVGSSNSGNLSERWNGTHWSVLRTPSPMEYHGGLGGVSCTSATFCMASGAYCTVRQAVCDQGGGTVRGETARWNGHRWTLLLPPNPGGSMQTFLNSIACTSPSSCIVAGETHYPSGQVNTLAERWNGKRWRIQPTPNPSGAGFATILDLACASATECFGVGASDPNGNLVERWNGTSWQLMSVPNPPGSDGLFGVSCSAAATCTAVGHAGSPQGGFMTAERWDGTTWHIQATSLFTAASDWANVSVSCSTALTCMAVGGVRTAGTPTSIPFSQRWIAAGQSVGTALPPAAARSLSCPAKLSHELSSNPESSLSLILGDLGCNT